MSKAKRDAVRHLLSSSSYWQVPKFIVRKFGLSAGILLSEMLWCWVKFSDNEGWFHRSQESLERSTGLSSFQQNKAYNILIDNSLLKVKRKGLPARNWYQLNEDEILNLSGEESSLKNLGSRNQETKDLDPNELGHIYNKINNNKELLSKESNIYFSSKNSQSVNLPISNSKRTLKRRKKASYPMTLNPFIPKAVKEIVSYWNSYGLQNHKDPNTKLYRKVIISISRLNKGTFFKSLSINGNYSQYKTKKWTNQEILQAISNFSLAATNSDYLPKSEKSKDWLRRQSLPNFLWNEYGSDESEKSLLLKYFEDKPELSKQSMRPLKDNHPKMTKAIQRVYNEMTSNNLAPKNIPVNINNCFIKAARREAEFIKKLIKQRLIDIQFIRTNRSRAELFINAGLSNLKSPKDLRPHYLCSDYMFDDIYPRYLNDQAILEGTIH